MTVSEQIRQKKSKEFKMPACLEVNEEEKTILFSLEKVRQETRKQLENLMEGKEIEEGIQEVRKKVFLWLKIKGLEESEVKKLETYDFIVSSEEQKEIKPEKNQALQDYEERMQTQEGREKSDRLTLKVIKENCEENLIKKIRLLFEKGKNKKKAQERNSIFENFGKKIVSEIFNTEFENLLLAALSEGNYESTKTYSHVTGTLIGINVNTLIEELKDKKLNKTDAEVKAEEDFELELNGLFGIELQKDIFGEIKTCLEDSGVKDSDSAKIDKQSEQVLKNYEEIKKIVNLGTEDNFDKIFLGNQDLREVKGLVSVFEKLNLSDFGIPKETTGFGKIQKIKQVIRSIKEIRKASKVSKDLFLKTVKEYRELEQEKIGLMLEISENEKEASISHKEIGEEIESKGKSKEKFDTVVKTRLDKNFRLGERVKEIQKKLVSLEGILAGTSIFKNGNQNVDFYLKLRKALGKHGLDQKIVELYKKGVKNSLAGRVVKSAA